MKDQSKTKQVLIQELVTLRKKIAESEQAESARRRDGETLHLSVEDYRTIFDDISDVIFSADAEGKLTFISPAIAQLMGYQPGELEGKNLYQFIHTDDLFRIRGRVDELSRNILKPQEYRIITSSGTARWVMSYSRPLFRDGIFRGIRGVMTDIHSRKLIEEALRDSENRLREITTQIPGVVYQFYVRSNGAMGFYYISDRSESVLGLKPDLEGYFERFSAIVIPEHRDGFIKSIEKAAKEASEWKYEGRLQKPSGEIIWFSGNSTPSLRENELVFNGIVQDISDRKRAGDALRESEMKYRTLIETTQTGFVILNHNGIVLDANPEYVSLTGHNQLSDILGRNVIEWTADYEKEKNATAVDICYQEGSIRNLEIDYVDSRGHITPIEINATCMVVEGNTEILTLCHSIKARRQAEEALRDSEFNLRSIFRVAPIGIGLVSNRIIMRVNDRLCEMLGYSREELLGKSARIFYITDEEFDFVGKEKYLQIAEQGTGTVETRWMHKDGTIIDILLSSTPIEPGNLEAGVTFTALDITDRKHTEDALRKSEGLLRMITDNMSDMIRVSDLQGINSYVSPSHLKGLGYRSEERVGKSNFDIVHPDDIETIINVFSEGLASNRRVNVEYRARHADGHYVWLETVGDLLRDTQGNVTAVVMSSRDISDRKRAEEAMRDAQSMLQVAVAQSPSGILIADAPDVHIRLANPAAFAIRGGSTEILTDIAVEEHSRKWQTFYPDGTPVPSEELPLSRAILKGEVSRNEEVIIRHESGDERWVLANAAPIRDSGGNIRAGIVIFHDITDLKRAGEEKRKIEKQLLQAQKLESIGTLSGGIAHDFNNILTSMQGYVSLMQLDLKSDHPHYSRLEKIEEQIMSGANLTRQLLGFARGGKYEVKTTNPNELLEQSSEVFGRTKKEIAITKRFQEDIWTMEVDRGQIEQTLLNIYINAWQAMPEGGDLYLETRNIILNDLDVKPHGVQAGRYVKISITDTGIGMDELTRKRIFDPFFTTKEPGKGTGLGLASSYGIIKNHDGFITVYSEKGRGSTFNIYLPASNKEIVAEAIPVVQKSDTGRETILLVDDEESNIAVIKELLENLGYRVMTAGSGQEAIAIYMEKKKAINLVILDMVMPGMGGSKTFDTLLEIDSVVKILLASGYSINGEAQQILDKGCKGFIQKPFRIDELSRKIREVLCMVS